MKSRLTAIASAAAADSLDDMLDEILFEQVQVQVEQQEEGKQQGQDGTNANANPKEGRAASVSKSSVRSINNNNNDNIGMVRGLEEVFLGGAGSSAGALESDSASAFGNSSRSNANANPKESPSTMNIGPLKNGVAGSSSDLEAHIESVWNAVVAGQHAEERPYLLSGDDENNDNQNVKKRIRLSRMDQRSAMAMPLAAGSEQEGTDSYDSGVGIAGGNAMTAGSRSMHKRPKLKRGEKEEEEQGHQH